MTARLIEELHAQCSTSDSSSFDPGHGNSTLSWNSPTIVDAGTTRRSLPAKRVYRQATSFGWTPVRHSIHATQAKSRRSFHSQRFPTARPTLISDGSTQCEAASLAVTEPTVAFDPNSGRLTIYGNADANLVRESLTEDGFVELTIDGVTKSANASCAAIRSDIGRCDAGDSSRNRDGRRRRRRSFASCRSVSHDSLLVDSDSTVVVGGSVRVGERFEVTASVIEIDGSVTAHGGYVSLLSTSVTRVQGTIDVSAAPGGIGGRVEILGPNVALVDSATVDASGDQGGGIVLVGGDYQGSNPDIQNSQHVFVGEDAQIRADGLARGDGGRVIVWSDEVTRYFGTISARGGVEGGDGGFVEVSGKNSLAL